MPMPSALEIIIDPCNDVWSCSGNQLIAARTAIRLIGARSSYFPNGIDAFVMLFDRHK
jgi:hypothetical protein